MHNKAKAMACWAIEKAQSCGFDNISPQDWEDLKNCMEAAKAAVCIDKDYRIIEAMDKADEEEKDEMRYGYNNRRYSSGRYAPAGRGRYMGYKPYLMEGEDGIMDRYLNDPDFEHNMRMGFDYHPPMTYPAGDGVGRMYGYDENIRSNRVGTSYGRYNQMRRGYKETGDPDHKQKMNDAASMVVNDIIDIMQDVWADLDETEKAKNNQKILEAAKKYS